MIANIISKRNIKCRTRFGAWLAYNIYHNELTIRQTANRLRLSRVSVSQHVNGTHKPTFVHVLAYCYIFEKMNDETFNPDEIYKMVDEEL